MGSLGLVSFNVMLEYILSYFSVCLHLLEDLF